MGEDGFFLKTKNYACNFSSFASVGRVEFQTHEKPEWMHQIRKNRHFILIACRLL